MTPREHQLVKVKNPQRMVISLVVSTIIKVEVYYILLFFQYITVLTTCKFLVVICKLKLIFQLL